MVDSLKPREAGDVEAAIQWALAGGKTLEVAGRGTKRAIGRAAQWDATLDLSGLSGVTLYEPEELVLSAKAGTAAGRHESVVRQEQTGPAVGADGLRAGARHPARRRHDRRRDCRQPVGPAADQSRRRARSFPRLQRGVGPRRDLQVRRPRREER